MIYTIGYREISGATWDDFTEWLISCLGHPGTRWTTLTVDHLEMKLLVPDPIDVDLLLLRWGGRIQPRATEDRW